MITFFFSKLPPGPPDPFPLSFFCAAVKNCQKQFFFSFVSHSTSGLPERLGQCVDLSSIESQPLLELIDWEQFGVFFVVACLSTCATVACPVLFRLLCHRCGHLFLVTVVSLNFFSKLFSTLCYVCFTRARVIIGNLFDVVVVFPELFFPDNSNFLISIFLIRFVAICRHFLFLSDQIFLSTCLSAFALLQALLLLLLTTHQQRSSNCFRSDFFIFRLNWFVYLLTCSYFSPVACNKF